MEKIVINIPNRTSTSFPLAVPLHKQHAPGIYKLTPQYGNIHIQLKQDRNNLKTLLWSDDLTQAAIWKHKKYNDCRFEPLANSDKRFTRAYKLNTLKSSC